MDETIIDRIIAAIAPGPGDRIIEIGPGQEALTGPLLASGATLAVVEIDRDLAGRLRLHHPDLKVHEGDALDVDFADLAEAQPYRLVGNLPYNISTPILFHLLDQSLPPRDMHFMLQKEVVRRMTAGRGDRAQGRLGLMCQNRAEVTHLFDVPPASFSPQPRVDSAIVRVVPRDAPLVPIELQAVFDELVRHAFGRRRKTLRNSLRDQLSAEEIEAAGIDPGLRPEALGLEDFRSLAAAVAQRGDGPE